MRDPAGAVAGRIFAFRDISAESVVDQMKSDFVSAVSHELRRPLTSIYGFAETLLRQDVEFGDQERRTFLGYIASESERLTRIVETLLDVARLESGDLHVQLVPTDVGKVVSDVVRAAEAGRTNGNQLVVELEDGVPLEAEADREKLHQILDQLVDNAVKFSPGGGTVRVAARRGLGTVEVSVEDEGDRHLAGAADARSSRSSSGPTPTARRGRGSASSSCTGSSRGWAAGSGSSRPRERDRASPSSCRSPAVTHESRGIG